MADENQAHFTPEQVAEMVQAAVTAAVSPLAAEIENLKKAPPVAAAPKQEQPEYTRAQIDQAIESGQISRTDGEALWATQTERRAAKVAAEAATQAIEARAHEDKVSGAIGEYSAVVPRAFQEGTPERAKVKAEFDRLVSEGQPKTRATELVALRLTFGGIEGLKAAAGAQRERITSQEGGAGGGRGNREGGEDANGVPRDLDLSSKQVSHYTKLIDRGIYKGWDEVRAELKHARGRAA